MNSEDIANGIIGQMANRLILIAFAARSASEGRSSGTRAFPT